MTGFEALKTPTGESVYSEGILANRSGPLKGVREIIDIKNSPPITSLMHSGFKGSRVQGFE
jgi:hypothetical protein